MTSEHMEAMRTIAAEPAVIFGVLCDPAGHVAIDSSGMLQAATGDPVEAVGDSFEVHMDRESLGDIDLGQYDVTVRIRTFEPDREIAWDIETRGGPPIGHYFGYLLEPVEGATRVTQYYDWSGIGEDMRKTGLFPVISEAGLKATLGILARTVTAGI